MLYLAESLSGQCAYSLIYIHVYIQDSLSCTVKFDKSPPHQRHVLLSQWTNGRLRPLCSHLSGCPSLRLSPLSEIYDSISSRACHCSQRCSVITSCRTTAKHLLMHACGANAMCVCLSHVNMRFRPHPSIQAKGGGGINTSSFPIPCVIHGNQLTSCFFLVPLHHLFTVHTVSYSVVVVSILLLFRQLYRHAV